MSMWGRFRALVALGLVTLCVSTNVAASDSTEELYSLYCSSCHSVKNAEAPEAFNAAAWKKRMAKGPDTVLANVIKGVGNMPPQGTCFECTQADLRQLIRYMSSAK
jgi:cytochrome c5